MAGFFGMASKSFMKDCFDYEVAPKEKKPRKAKDEKATVGITVE